MTQQNETPPTIITLTLPSPEGGGIPTEHATATLLIQYGELAHVHQFCWGGINDLNDAVHRAFDGLRQVQSNPPIIPDLPEDKPTKKVKLSSKTSVKVDTEPTIDIPLKKGTKAVKISHLKIIGGETDAAAYRQAVLIAGKLIMGGLWDGETPIQIDDVYATMKKMQYLNDKDLSLFKLADFVQTETASV